MGWVLTGELDDDDSVSYDTAATDAARASRPAPAEVFSDRGPGYARLSGGVSYADVYVVGL
jgi:N-methylhydantoinase B